MQFNFQFTMPYKILIVDDHLVVRAGVSIILKKEFNDIDVTEAASYPEALSILNQFCFDLIILDINLPGGKNTEMIKEIKHIDPKVKILMFSAHEEEIYALRYIISGADGYLNKLSSEESIVKAVHSIRNFGSYTTLEVLKRIEEQRIAKSPINPFEKLSARESEICKLLIKGEGNLEISNALDIQMSTVSTYKSRIFEKLQVNNLAELIELNYNYLD